MQGVFKKVATAKGDAAGAHAGGAPQAPLAIHPSIGEWAKWVAGPFTTITHNPPTPMTLMGGKWTWKNTSLRWTPPTSTSLPSRTTQALDADRSFLVRALGAYAASKHDRPNLQAMQFQPVSQPDQHPPQSDDVAPEQGRMLARSCVPRNWKWSKCDKA